MGRAYSLHSTDLIGRAIAAAVVLVISFGAATVFEAAAKADIAFQVARAAQDASDDPAFRIAELEHAADLIETSWAKPTGWHGGADETLSWIYARISAETADGDRAALEKSDEAAIRAVRLTPIQPASWARLAALADKGLPTPCAVTQCLERSWMAAKFIDSNTACARLRLANEHGMLGAFDDRVRWFARNSLHQAEVEQCLDFLPPQELFHALMIFTIQDAIWQEDQQD